MERYTSEKQRKATFEVMLLGSDKAINAYNDFMQHIYHSKDKTQVKDDVVITLLFGKVLLAMRKDFKKYTHLTEKDMLRSMITDIDDVVLPEIKKR